MDPRRPSAINIDYLTDAFAAGTSLLSPGHRENDHRLVQVARSIIDSETLGQLEAMFDAMDTTGDGRLTQEDFVSQVGIGQLEAQSNEFWRIMNQWYDINKDGMVTPEEFVVAFVSAALLKPVDLNLVASQVVPAPGNAVTVNIRPGDLLKEFEDHFRSSMRDLMRICQEGLHLKAQDPGRPRGY